MENKLDCMNTEMPIDKYIEYIEKRDNLLYKEKPRMIALYLFNYQDLLEKEMNLTISIKKLRLDMDTLLINENPNDITHKLMYYKEIYELKEKLENFKKNINDNEKYRNEKKLTKDEMIEISLSYKELMKKLNPEIIINTSINKIKLWKKTKDAYIKNDLGTLRMLMNIVKKENIKINNNITIINEKIEDIKEEIDIIYEMYPFNIKNYIYNEKDINQFRNEINEKIEILLFNEEAMKKTINMIDDNLNKNK